MKVKKIRLGNWSEFLTDNEMKNVLGRYGWPYPSGTCGAINNEKRICCVSKDAALEQVASGGRWCCDSCDSTDYCGEWANMC